MGVGRPGTTPTTQAAENLPGPLGVPPFLLPHPHAWPWHACRQLPHMSKAAVLGISICCSSCLARAGVECGLSFSRHGRVMP
jgi:hypothetical protein